MSQSQDTYHAGVIPARNPLYLASSSPRRRLLLGQMGLEATVIPPDIDDGLLQPGAGSPEDWVTGLAYLKARRVADHLQHTGTMTGIVLGADTVCVHGRQILGQPQDADQARSMLRLMRRTTHRTITGVCLINLADDRRLLFHDEAEVRIGDVSDEQIENYLDSGEWQGKAGAYNLSDRQDAGWPIECQGDPATVMGLPVQRLTALLEHELFAEHAAS